MRVAFLGNDPWSVAPLRRSRRPRTSRSHSWSRTRRVPRDEARSCGRPRWRTRRELDLRSSRWIVSGTGRGSMRSSRSSRTARRRRVRRDPDAGRPRHPSARCRERALLAAPALARRGTVQHAILAGDEVDGRDRDADGRRDGHRSDPRDTGDGDRSRGGCGYARRSARRDRGLAPRRCPPRVRRGTIEPRAQDHTAATLASKLRPRRADHRLGDDRGGDRTQVRAFAPDPGATTTFRGQPLKVVGAMRPRSADRMIADPDIRAWGRLGEGTPVVVGLGDGGGTGSSEVVPRAEADERCGLGSRGTDPAWRTFG